MLRDKLFIGVYCAAALIHVHVSHQFAVSRYARRRIFGNTLIWVSAIAGGGVVASACAFGSSCDAHLPGSLTVSNVVAGSPWCAAFAVTVCCGALGMRDALEATGVRSTYVVVSSVLFAAFPNVGGFSYLHFVFLVGIALSSAHIAYEARFKRALGGEVVPVFRMHVFAAFVTGLASLALSFVSDWISYPLSTVELATISLESASIAHIIYAYI